MRGFDKVRGEWSLMALCYNFTRMLNILGFDRFTDYLARRRAERAMLLVASAATTIRRASAFMTRIWITITQKTATIGLRFNPPA